MSNPLTRSQVDEFHANGVLVLRSFYDPENDLYPILRGIHSIIGLVIKRSGLAVGQPPFDPQTFDSGYQDLIAADRRYGGDVYDAVKQIPAFMRLVAEPRHESILCQLRNTDLAGIAAVGYGIRIDNPHEERFRAAWHQEYLGQLRSLDGISLWIPLLRINASLGAVEFCVGSHKEGLFKVRAKDPNHSDKTGAYAVLLDREEKLVSRYARVAPETDIGDLILLDFLVVHRSGINCSSRARWSMQTRYFNFHDPTGIRIGWCGSYAAGNNVMNVHPEAFVSPNEVEP
jgi:hypothetical protein